MMVSSNGDYAAINASKFIRRHGNNAATSVARLSSGIRINSGADDPAGIVTAGNLKKNAAASDAAAQNAQNAAAWGKAADSAYGSALDILYRMREIATLQKDTTADGSSNTALSAEMTALNGRLGDMANAKFGSKGMWSSASFTLGIKGSQTLSTTFGGGVSKLSSTTLSAIDSKITSIATAQGTAGATASALGYIADGLAADSAAMWDAYDEYTKANTASEMTKFVRNSVYEQSAQLILSQYNQNAYSVLNLLR
ncbi:MAG: hypothetical protein SR3Q1_05000 [Quinella sp. 3Q1]|nr:hypothetical protein [Quinella sp. 3Q1]